MQTRTLSCLTSPQRQALDHKGGVRRPCSRNQCWGPDPPEGGQRCQGHKGHLPEVHITVSGCRLPHLLVRHQLTINQGYLPQVSEVVSPHHGADGALYQKIIHWDLCHWGESVLLELPQAGEEPPGGWINFDQDREQQVKGLYPYIPVNRQDRKPEKNQGWGILWRIDAPEMHGYPVRIIPPVTGRPCLPWWIRNNMTDPRKYHQWIGRSCAPPTPTEAVVEGLG